MESGGCVMTNRIARQRAENNREAEANIRRKYGMDWKRRFIDEVASEYKKQQKKPKVSKDE